MPFSFIREKVGTHFVAEERVLFMKGFITHLLKTLKSLKIKLNAQLNEKYYYK